MLGTLYLRLFVKTNLSLVKNGGGIRVCKFVLPIVSNEYDPHWEHHSYYHLLKLNLENSGILLWDNDLYVCLVDHYWWIQSSLSSAYYILFSYGYLAVVL